MSVDDRISDASWRDISRQAGQYLEARLRFYGERTDNFGDCGACGKELEVDSPDPCLGRLPGVQAACCGHGEPAMAYVLFKNGMVVRGFDVIAESETEAAR